MAWTVEFTDIAERTISKLDPDIRKRINGFFRKRYRKLRIQPQLQSRSRESFVGCGAFALEIIGRFATYKENACLCWCSMSAIEERSTDRLKR